MKNYDLSGNTAKCSPPKVHFCKSIKKTKFENNDLDRTTAKCFQQKHICIRTSNIPTMEMIMWVGPLQSAPNQKHFYIRTTSQLNMKKGDVDGSTLKCSPPTAHFC